MAKIVQLLHIPSYKHYASRLIALDDNGDVFESHLIEVEQDRYPWKARDWGPFEPMFIRERK